MSYINQSYNTTSKYSIEPSNKTEQLLFNKIRDYKNGWTKINETHREFRIGVEPNCNGEMTKNIVHHQKTADEMIAFINKYNIQKFSLETVDNDYEYSNKLQIENSDYDELAKQVLLRE